MQDIIIKPKMLSQNSVYRPFVEDIVFEQARHIEPKPDHNAQLSPKIRIHNFPALPKGAFLK